MASSLPLHERALLVPLSYDDITLISALLHNHRDQCNKGAQPMADKCHELREHVLAQREVKQAAWLAARKAK